jgi:hypothetical protein
VQKEAALTAVVVKGEGQNSKEEESLVLETVSNLFDLWNVATSSNYLTVKVEEQEKDLKK